MLAILGSAASAALQLSAQGHQGVHQDSELGAFVSRLSQAYNVAESNYSHVEGKEEQRMAVFKASSST